MSRNSSKESGPKSVPKAYRDIHKNGEEEKSLLKSTNRVRAWKKIRIFFDISKFFLRTIFKDLLMKKCLF